MGSLLALALWCGAAAARAADESPEPGAPVAAAESFAIHGQVSYVEQETDAFRAPYRGPNSLSPSKGAETVDATLALGGRLWRGAEGWVTPEIDQGFGLDDTLGLAGFASGKAYKVGSKAPYWRLPRAFVRQSVATGTDGEEVEGSAGQLAGWRSTDRWVFTLGKFAVTDVFDTNRYAHDPGVDFFNWAAVDSGAFDYAADSWGYTAGAAAERYLGSWTWRAGVFDLSDVPNSESLEHGLHEFQAILEIEKRYRLFGQTARILVTGYQTRGRMALLADAIALGEAAGTSPNPAAVRRYRSRFGAVLNLEQPITPAVGLFARVGKAQGSVEVYEFADIDRSTAVGVSVNGAAWHQPLDTVGIVAIDNGISAIREQYLSDGGLGLLVGDGRLPHPGAEQIVETYYSRAVFPQTFVTLDYQWVNNPAYNRDRGPVSLFAVRVHAAF